MDLLKLRATLGLDTSEYEQGLDKAEGSAKSAGNRIGKVGSVLKSGVGLAAKASVAAVGSASTAIGVLVKKSVDGYAELEQLRGGVETLFGQSAQVVMANADNAFKTAGMSANQYMETTIQSAAAMISSLGGDQKKAAEMSNMAITDMADNVNKMGTSMESVQDAYRGFSRSNFTMLDNLALGFAGTKEGMQELLDKAEEISGVHYDIKSYADIVQAIHVVQDEMGITGTTAKEASETISGSIESMKSAWSNLVAGFADPDADISKLMKNLTTSAATVAKNLVPAIGRAAKGVAEGLKQIIPEVINGLPKFIDEVVIPLGQAGYEAILVALSTLHDKAPDIARAMIGVVGDAVNYVIEKLPDFLNAVANGFVEYFPILVEQLLNLVDGLVEQLDTNADGLIDAGINFVMALIEGVSEALPVLIERVPEIIIKFNLALFEHLPEIIVAGGRIPIAIAKGILAGLIHLPSAAMAAIKTIADRFGVHDWTSLGRDVMRGLAQGIYNWMTLPIRAIDKVASFVVDKAKSVLQINSPSKVFREKIGAGIAEGMAYGITDGIPVVTKAMDDLSGRIVAPALSDDYISYADDDGFSEENAYDVVNTPVIESADVGRDVTVVLQLDRTQLARTVFRLNNEETQRVGVNLVGGNA